MYLCERVVFCVYILSFLNACVCLCMCEELEWNRLIQNSMWASE